MRSIEGERVFFKNKGRRILQDYWCKRWDELKLREILSLNYTPRYYAEKEFLDGYYIQLRNIDFLWFRGLFSVGKHLKTGVYYQDPIHLSLKGLGPRQLVFPLKLLDHLGQLTLLGDWTRYQYSATNWLNEDRKLIRAAYKGGKIHIRVDEVKMGFPPPLASWWGNRFSRYPTVCLCGEVLDSKLEGFKIEVPVSEVYWNLLKSD